jgi:hypothetical protein
MYNQVRGRRGEKRKQMRRRRRRLICIYEYIHTTK